MLPSKAPPANENGRPRPTARTAVRVLSCSLVAAAAGLEVLGDAAQPAIEDERGEDLVDGLAPAYESDERQSPRWRHRG
jgi:hypothetical protein